MKSPTRSAEELKPQRILDLVHPSIQNRALGWKSPLEIQPNPLPAPSPSIPTDTSAAVPIPAQHGRFGEIFFSFFPPIESIPTSAAAPEAADAVPRAQTCPMQEFQNTVIPLLTE